MGILRRYLVISSFAFWIGGFTFYSLVVIHVGARVLGSHRKQGLVTQQVSNWLNVSGAIALTILLWNMLAMRRGISRRLHVILAVTWAVMLLMLLAQLILHSELDTALEQNAPEFYSLHRTYLGISSLQWLAALVHLFVLTCAGKDNSIV